MPLIRWLVDFFGLNGMLSFLPVGVIENLMSGPWQLSAKPSVPIRFFFSSADIQ